MSDPQSNSDTSSLESENKNLRRELLAMRQFIDCMQNLMDAVESPGSELEIMDLLEQVLENALETIDAKDGSLMVVDEDTNELVFVITHGEVPSETLNWKRLPAGRGIAGWVVENRRATIVNDAQSDERFYVGIDESVHYKTESIIAAPIIGADEVLGVIEILNKRNGRLFHSQDLTLLTLLCRFAGELLHSIVARNSISRADSDEEIS